MTEDPYTKDREYLECSFRHFSLEGDTAFQAIAYGYIKWFHLHNVPEDIVSKFELSYKKVEVIDSLSILIDEVVSKDPHGRNLHNWYQFFIGRKYRESSGKFFTPLSIASAMVSLIPEKDDAIIMDPTCGGGIFLIEAAKRWKSRKCILVANDIETSLIELTIIALCLTDLDNHSKHFMSTNIFYPDLDFEGWYGKVDYILANPPFSLKIDNGKFSSPLFLSGYRSSDALFLDIAQRLLKPGGRIVCLLPHSIISNKEFSNLREIVEEYFNILGAISLPEGIFYANAGTSTRADIVVLQKRASSLEKPNKIVFASVPSVGFKLNSRSKKALENDLEDLVETPSIQQAFGVI